MSIKLFYYFAICLVVAAAWRFLMSFRNPIPYHEKLDAPLLKIGRRQTLTIRDACEGIAIFGGTGSGKTSSSGNALARAYLKSGMGGIVFCAKPGEADRWRKLAQRHGRQNDVIVFDSTGQHRLNFMDYAQATVAKDGFDINLVMLLTHLSEASKAQSNSASDSSDNAFFRDAATQLIANAIPLLRVVYRSIRLKDLYQFIVSAPTTRDEINDPQWQAQSFCSQTLMRAAFLAEQGDQEAARIFDEHADYWLYEFSSLGDRTRGSVIATLTSTLYPFLSGKLNELFCTHTTIAPAEMAREGIILVLDLPTRSFGPAGAIGQQIVKLLFQMVIESAPIDEHARPVFCFLDEAQFFVNARDQEHLAVCRQSKVCNVFISQDLPTYFSVLGDEETAKALVAKFQTRIFHANTDAATNRYASDIIGRTTHYNVSSNYSDGYNSGIGDNIGEDAGGYSAGSGRNRGRSRGVTSYQDLAIPPEYFGRSLRNGGTKNRRLADAILVRNSGQFIATKSNWIKAEFAQS